MTATMFVLLYTFALALAGKEVSSVDAMIAAMDVRHAVLESEPLFERREGEMDDGIARYRTARLLLVWSYRESRWKSGAQGDHDASKVPHAFGVMQIHPEVWAPVLKQKGLTFTSADLLDGETSFKVSLAVLHELKARCGSVKKALHAYASGRCEGTARSFWTVKERCELAGGC